MIDTYPKPRIVVSKCLGFAKCRYDGRVLPNKFIEHLKKFVTIKTVCPEMEIGLGVPRDPIRLVDSGSKAHLYQPATGIDVTRKMKSFARLYLESLSDIDGFILKSRSPSCGTRDVKVYHNLKPGAGSSRDAGLFGKAAQTFFPGLIIEDEGRLSNFNIREHFLTSLYTLARFRKIKKNPSMKKLVKFHTDNKMLLLGYHQSQSRLLGKVVANHDQAEPEKVYAGYEAGLQNALQNLPKFRSQINVIHHMFGGFSDKLSADEKRMFLNTVEEYRDERIPLSVLTYIIKSYAVRFKNEYLLNQTFLFPYPPGLVKVSDSGKGRKLT